MFNSRHHRDIRRVFPLSGKSRRDSTVMNKMQDVCVKALQTCIPDLKDDVAFAAYNKYGYKHDLIHGSLTLCGMGWWADGLRERDVEDAGETEDDPKPL